jgi:hypothetical protein
VLLMSGPTLRHPSRHPSQNPEVAAVTRPTEIHPKGDLDRRSRTRAADAYRDAFLVADELNLLMAPLWIVDASDLTASANSWPGVKAIT